MVETVSNRWSKTKPFKKLIGFFIASNPGKQLYFRRHLHAA